MVAVTAHNSIQLTVEEAAELLHLVAQPKDGESVEEPERIIAVPENAEFVANFLTLTSYLESPEQNVDLLRLLAEHPGLDEAVLTTTSMLTERPEVTRFWIEANVHDTTSPLTIWISEQLDKDARRAFQRELYDWWKVRFDAYTRYVLLAV